MKKATLGNVSKKVGIQGSGMATLMEGYVRGNYQDALNVVLEFVERWNKNDDEVRVAEAVRILDGLKMKDWTRTDWINHPSDELEVN